MEVGFDLGIERRTMGTKTGIEWTDSTWNPIRGCSRVSEGCRNCYAEKVAYRFSGEGQLYEGLAVLRNGHASWTGEVAFVEKHLLDPLKLGPVVTGCLTGEVLPHAKAGHCPKCGERQRRIFVNSMSDLFHENVTDEMRDKIFAVMALCPQHTFQVLTKRPQRMLEYLTQYPKSRNELCWRWHVAQAIDGLFPIRTERSIEAKERVIDQSPLPNVWLGVSVEDQKTADTRIPLFLQTPAAVRFISAEPLLGPVDLTSAVVAIETYAPGETCKWSRTSLEVGDVWHSEDGDVSDGPEYPALDWVICGGESGPGARPMHPDWARGLRDQCAAAGVPFFFEQWGEWSPIPEWIPSEKAPQQTAIALDGSTVSIHVNPDEVGGHRMMRVGKRDASSLLDGAAWKQFPKVAQA